MPCLIPTELIQCPDLTIPNGQVTISQSGRGLGSTTTYECNPGFALVGDGNRVCQKDSTWSGVDPQCGKCFLCSYVLETIAVARL